MVNIKYAPYGISCNPDPVEKGEKVRLLYEGILAKDGADKVFAHLGFGPATKWSYVNSYEMDPVGDKRFEVQFTAVGKGNLNVVFKDSAEHWDNNGGSNYVFEGR